MIINNFTKEELEQLLFDLDAKIFELGEENIHPFSLSLRDKIQSMINNYCEHEECQHESDGVHYHMQSKSNPNKFIAPIWKCTKCGEFYR